MTVGPTVVAAIPEGIHCLVGPCGSQVVRTLICRPETTVDPLQAYRIPQALCENPAVLSIGIHLEYGRANRFFFDARITARSDRDIELAVWGKRDRPGQVPASVFVVESVCGKFSD